MIEEEEKQMQVDTQPIDIKNDHHKKKQTKEEKRGRVFIRNLPFTATQEKLKLLFEKFGKISDVNLPMKENKSKLKGYGFIQFETKRDALKAIKEMNNHQLEGRKLELSLAKPKDEYQQEKVEDIQKKKLENPKPNRFFEGRTLFIKNLNFNTEEENLKKLFEKFGKVIWARIVKNKETGTSRGTGFVLLSDEEQTESILRIYERAQNSGATNPFELEGRNLIIMKALPKDKAEHITEERKTAEADEDRRNYKLLFYGLNTLGKFKHSDVSDEDQEKRELLIKVKKTEFKNNPNYHISATRITVRNLSKKINEEKLKDLVKEETENFLQSLEDEEMKEYYNKTKKIKQIKLLRDDKVLDKDGKPKSKSIAFIEVCDTLLGKYLIDNLNNLKVDNAKRGLILEFSLEDIRKKAKRERILSERRSKILEERRKNRKMKKNAEKESKSSNDNSTEKTPKESIDNITDMNKLMEIYHSTLSRGKKQRIKKRIAKLGYNPESYNFKKTNSNPAFAKKPNDSIKPNYIVTKVDLRNISNSSNKEEDGKKKNGKMLGGKRERKSQSVSKRESFRKKRE